MALIKLGGLAQDVRGSLNGTVFSRNRGGAYTRTKVSPIQPVTDALANTRQSFKIVSQAWAQQLTDSERAGWTAFAATHPFINVFGDSIVLSGIGFFQAGNKRLQQLGFPIIADAPLTWDVDPPSTIDPVMSIDGAGNCSLLINPTNPPSGPTITAFVFATKAIPAGATPQKNQFRLINEIDGTVRDDTYDFGDAYKARFDPYLPGDGEKIAILYAYMNTDNGAISVSSMTTILANTIPGPLIDIGIVEAIDDTGGNVTRYYTTSTPHGYTTGDHITTTNINSNFNKTNIACVVDTPTVFHFASSTGTALPPTGTSGHAQRVS